VYTSGIDQESLEAEVRKFVVDTFLFGKGGDKLSSDDSFIALGIIDSTGVLELAAHIEQSYSFRIQDGELVPENMDSIRRIATYVRGKLSAMRGPAPQAARPSDAAVA
jgi:acyl carrier protein